MNILLSAKNLAIAALVGGVLTTERIKVAVAQAIDLTQGGTGHEVNPIELTLTVMNALVAEVEPLVGEEFANRIGMHEAAELVMDTIRTNHDQGARPPSPAELREKIAEAFPLVNAETTLRLILKSGMVSMLAHMTGQEPEETARKLNMI